MHSNKAHTIYMKPIVFTVQLSLNVRLKGLDHRNFGLESTYKNYNLDRSLSQ